MNKGRTWNTFLGTSTGLLGYVITYSFTFIYRTVFIYYLGKEYLGLQGLFSNILSLLSLAELGIGSAIMFSLYKPIADKDEQKILALMQFYKRAYRIIALTVFALGVAVAPFIKSIVGKAPNVSEPILLIYALYVLDASLSYLLIYKQSLIRAYQRNQIIYLYNNAASILRTLVQIAWLAIFCTFIPVLVIQITFTVLGNYLISRKADRLYPYLRQSSALQLDKAVRYDIIHKIKAMFNYRLGAFVVAGTNNILISTFFGISWVGVYSNYNLLTSMANRFMKFFTEAVTPGIGNVTATSSTQDTKRIFRVLDFVYFWVYSTGTVVFYLAINRFITIWVGTGFLLSDKIVAVIVINFYLYGMHQNMLVFRNALGLFIYARWKPIAEALINIASSLMLIHYFGFVGVFLGITVSFVTTSLWIEPLVLYKHYFNEDVREYFIRYLLGVSVTLASIIASMLLTRSLAQGTLLSFLLSVLIGLTVHNALITLVYHRRMEFRELKRRLKSFVRVFMHRKRTDNP